MSSLQGTRGSAKFSRTALITMIVLAFSAFALTVVPTTANAAPALNAVFGAPTYTSRIGGPGGLPDGPDQCPAGAAMTGAVGSVAADQGTGWITGAQLVCSPVTAGTSGAQVGSATAAGSLTGTRSNVTTGTSSCPTGSLVTGIQGRGGELVDGFELICTALSAAGTLDSESPGGYVGGDGGVPVEPITCPAGAVATGMAGNDGQDLDSLGLVCRTLTFVAVAPQPDNSAWPNAQLVSGTSTTDGVLATPGQQLWYKFPVVPGSQVQVALTGLAANYDIALFSDIGQAFTTLTSTSDLTKLSAEFAGDAFSPSAFSPSAFSPSAFSPSAFSPSAFSPSTFSPSAFSPSAFSPSAFSPSAFSPSAFSPSTFSPAVDVPSAFSPSAFSPSAFNASTFAAAFSSAQTRSLLAVSAHDSTAPESITAQTWNNTGDFYVRVQGRNGASSSQPFHLGVATTGGPCAGLTLNDYASTPTIVGAAGPSTVILTDPTRLPGTVAQQGTLSTSLAALAARVNGVVVDVSKSARVVALNQQADGPALACPYAKNLVAQAVRDVVNTYRGTGSTLQYVVVVGGDGTIPFFRYPDNADIGPESGYVPPVADDTSSQASLRSNYLLSEDAYGAATDISVKGTTMPVADVSVGRLVKTAPEVTSTVQNYLGLSSGAISPASTLATGYDFLAGGAKEVAADFAAGTPGGLHDTLITNQGVPTTTTTVGGVPAPTTSWTATDLSKELFGTRHDLVYLAGHFSANSALAADYTTSVLTSDLAAAPAANFKNTVVFSAGCHSGYDIVDADGLPGVTDDLDWPEAFAQKGATLIGGTGYQYGDTDFVRYSVQLYSNFARQLRYGQGAVAVGTALRLAKQQYLTDTADLQGIDQKALLESTLYGLPMLGVNLPGGRLVAPTDTSVVSPSGLTTGPGKELGLSVAPVTVTPTLTTATKTLTSTAGGSVTASYLSGVDGTASSPAAPTLPLLNLNVSSPSNQVLRGVGFRSGTYTDTSGVIPLTGAATTDQSGVHSAFTSTALYPNRIATANYYGALTGGATRLLVTPAQYVSDAPGALTTTQRAYSALGMNLFYSSNIVSYGANTPALAGPPSMSRVIATPSADGTSVALEAHVVGDPSAGIQQVWFTYTGVAGSALHGQWASTDATQDAADSTLWSATVSLPAGQDAAAVRFMVQAVNGVGLVGADDNQGTYYQPGVTAGAIDPNLAPATLSLNTGTVTTGAYGTSASISATLTGGDGSPLAGRAVEFGICGTSATATTTAAGVATANVPIIAAPGSCTLTASFDGDAATAPAASSAIPFTVTRPVPVLTLRAGIGSGTTAANGVTARLLGPDGLPLPQKTVMILATDPTTGATRAALPQTTDSTGSVSVPADALPTGSAVISALFGSARTPLPGGGTVDLTDPVYAGATAGGLQTAAIATSALPGAILNSAYTASIVATGTPAPNLSATGLPPGISLSQTGGTWTLSGHPTHPGAYSVVLTASNGIGLSVTRKLTLVVGLKMSPFTQPINDPAGAAMSVFSERTTVVVQFALTDGLGQRVSLADALRLVLTGRVTIAVTPTGGSTTQKVNEAVVILPVQQGKFFFYDPFNRQFTYLASAANSAFVAGRTYTITAAVAGDGGVLLAQHSVVIGINK